MKRRVLLTEEIHEGGIRLLRDSGYDVRMGTGIDESTLLREIQDCDAVLTRNAVISERIMRAAPRLKVIAMHGVGVDNIDVDAATALNIQVVNAADSNKNSVAEYTIALILNLAKRIPLYHEELRKGNWSIRKTIGADVAGMTLGIIGMGNIGSLVAQKAALGLGMRVLAYKRNLSHSVPVAHVEYTNQLDKVIREADYLTLHIPGSAATAKLIGARELSLMKPTACLINTARGEVVDEEALYEALSSHRIAGAAIDVFVGGVPAPDHPLFGLDNVLVSPHTAAFAAQSVERMALHSALGVDEVLSGRKPSWPVNTLTEVGKLCV